MNRTIATLSLSLAAILSLASAASAQNLVISNARIIVGPGQTIEKGAVVITNGRISSVHAGTAPATPKGAKVINATGMTVIAGYIDDHRHIIQAGGRGGNELHAKLHHGAEARLVASRNAGTSPAGIGLPSR